MSDQKSDYAPGTFGCHEALHMASFLAATIDEEILQHPAIEAVPEWRKLADDAFTAMSELYRQISDRHMIAPQSPPKRFDDGTGEKR